MFSNQIAEIMWDIFPFPPAYLMPVPPKKPIDDDTLVDFLSIELSDCERLTSTYFLRWTGTKLGLSTYQDAASHVALAVEPSHFFSDEGCIVRALRKALDRVLSVTEQLASPDVSVPCKTAWPTDQFTDEVCAPGDAYWPFTAEGLADHEPANFYATADSWAYHCTVNGPVHPHTRKPILGFGRLVAADDAAPANAAEDPLATLMAYTPEMRLSLRTSMATALAPKVFGLQLDLESFEAYYAIPHDRSLTQFEEASESDSSDGWSMDD